MNDDTTPRRGTYRPPRVASNLDPPTVPLPPLPPPRDDGPPTLPFPAALPPTGPAAPAGAQPRYAQPQAFSPAGSVPAGPASLGPTPPAPARARQPAGAARRAAANALALLAVVNAVFLLATQVPELLPTWPPLFTQLTPLVATPLTGGVALVDAQGSGLVQTVWLLAVLVLYVAARRQGPYRLVGLGAAVLSTVLAVVAALLGLVSADKDAAVGAALAIIVGLLTGRAANALRTAAPPDSDRAAPRRDQIGTGFLLVYGASLVLPLAVGRALFAPELAEIARALSDGPLETRFLALGHITTLWLYLAGLSVGVVVWAALQLLPPWAGRSLVRPASVALLVLAAGWVWIGSLASSSGEQRVTEIRVEHPEVFLPVVPPS